jgi:hypothetical protein
MSEPTSTIPWSSRAPQNYVLALVAIVIAVALVITAIAYIAAGTGGVVPFLMLVGAPTLCVVYVYVFVFKKWDAA